MDSKRHLLILSLLVVATLLMPPGIDQARGYVLDAPAFADPAFENMWNRTDSLVAQGKAPRSWYWGPQANTEGMREELTDAPDGTGQRLVQYFDKSRMEINDPKADPNGKFYVTNGLLTVELIGGCIQTSTQSPCGEERAPAEISVAGDPGDRLAPTYASLQKVANSRFGDRPAQDRRNGSVTATLDRAGNVDDDPGKSAIPLTRIVYYNAQTRHNIPEAFWAFLNQKGDVLENGTVVNSPLSEPWYYVTGLPISEAYWAHAIIAGKDTEVMLQAFERRILTYTPTNPKAFQVEMGNIGQHYYDWRYNTMPPTPIEVYPQDNDQIWGDQVLSIRFSPWQQVKVKDVAYDSASGANVLQAGQRWQSLIRPDNPLSSAPGVYEIGLCAECLQGQRVQVRVEFAEPATQQPITRTYQVVHMPVMRLATNVDLRSGEAVLDAGGSTDPQGLPLTFRWFQGQTTTQGARLVTDLQSLENAGLAIEISNGTATATDLLITSFDPGSGRLAVVPAGNKLKCTKMTLNIAGASTANSKITLGPIPPNPPNPNNDPNLPKEPKLELNGTRLKKNQFVGFIYEVIGDTVASDKDHKEGLESAALYAPQHPQNALKAPDEIAKLNVLTIQDLAKEKRGNGVGYSKHPSRGVFGSNRGLQVTLKSQAAVGVNTSIIWTLESGAMLPQMLELGNGGYRYRKYERIWMDPDIAACDLRLMYELEITTDGTVKQNAVTQTQVK